MKTYSGNTFILLSLVACEIHPDDSGSDSGHSGSIDDSGISDSGALDSAHRDTGPSETGLTDDSTTSFDLDCDGSKDDGRAIKLCNPDDTVGVSGYGLGGRCDANGDGVADLAINLSTDTYNGVYVVTDFSASGLLPYVPDLIAESGLHGSFGRDPSCDGDRDGDGYNDLLVTDNEDGPEDGAAFVFDGPITTGMSSDDAVGILGSNSWEENVGSAAWVSGAGVDGGAAALYGSQSNYYKVSYAYFETDPVGTILAEDTTAQMTQVDVEDRVVGDRVESADMDGDGAADVVVSTSDDTSGTPGGQISWLPASDADGDVWLDIESHLYGTSTYGVYGGDFAVGDIDDDGYTDLFALLAQGTSTDSSLGSVYYGLLASRSANSADAYIDITGSSEYSNKYAVVLDDFNGDGRSGDLMLVHNTNLYLYSSPPSGALTEADALTITSTETFGLLTPTSLGDVNGDGLDDLAVLDPYDDEMGHNVGALYIFFGGSW